MNGERIKVGLCSNNYNIYSLHNYICIYKWLSKRLAMLLISYGSMFQILCLRICICYSRFGIRSLNIKSISLTCLYFWCGSYKGITIVDNSYEWRLMDHKLHLELIFNHFNFWLCRVMWSSLLIYLTQVLQQFCSFYLCISVLIAESRT